MFITIEGLDGAGKSTQSKLLSEYLSLSYKKENIILTREPGGTKLNEAIRELLIKSPEHYNVDNLSELLFFIAMRREHFVKVIKPALLEGKIVICDRFIDSTIAYQGYGNGIDINLVTQLNNLSVENFLPNITFIIDVDITQSLQRAKLNRFEKTKDDFFFSKVKQGFYVIANQDPNRCYLIKDKGNTLSSSGIQQIHTEIIEIINKKY